MKTPKPVVDKSAAPMSKGATNRDSQNAPKGVDFKESLTSQAPDVSLGMQQHRKSAKSGNRHGGPMEHMSPSAGTFHKL